MKNYTITVNGNVYDVTVEEGGEGNAATTQTKSAAPKKVSAPAAPKSAPASEGAGSVKVNSPMPGKILNVKKSVGDSVEKGDVILILEAIKMENEIVAPSDGTIASIDVSVGSEVAAGDVLATLD